MQSRSGILSRIIGKRNGMFVNAMARPQLNLVKYTLQVSFIRTNFVFTLISAGIHLRCFFF